MTPDFLDCHVAALLAMTTSFFAAPAVTESLFRVGALYQPDTGSSQ
jgi:hypothetical protein